jgi:hypothetical protein
MLPGSWLEIATLIPRELVTDPLRIRIVPHMGDGHYLPYYHWIYAPKYDRSLPDEAPFATFQDNAILLYDPQLEHDGNFLNVRLNWGTDGSAQGDYKVFAHVLDENDGIAAQADNRPGNGTLPPGNWLPGVFEDTFVVDLTELSSGTYRVAIGLYDPITFERLTPSNGDAGGRLFIGEVEIDGDG